MSIILKGGASSNLADVNSSGQVKIVPEISASNNPHNVGCVRTFCEVDPGAITGTPYLISPEADTDYRTRITSDVVLDTEIFNYTGQNTGKHTYSTTTLTVTWATSGITTNGGSVNTTGAGTTFGTYAEFPIFGACNLYCEVAAAFTTQPVSNCNIDFGLFRRGTTSQFAPTDGIYFRLTSTGLQGVINYNDVETTTSNFNFTYVENQVNQFIIAITQRNVDFFINDVLYGSLLTPEAQGQPCLSATLPFSLRHAHPGTAGGVLQMKVNAYNISLSGVVRQKDLGDISNGVLGSYQGLSGGTMGSLATYTNSTNPTAAVPSNTALTANLPGGLGGQAWETFSSGLSANVDGILCSYQVPAATTAIQGKRLKITGVKMSAFIQTAMTGGGFNSTFTLAYGHTAVSLATAEGATSKARRIVLLPELTQFVSASQIANQLVPQNSTISVFDQPIFVNSGEFVAFCVKHIGTVASAGVVAYNIQYVYSWE